MSKYRRERKITFLCILLCFAISASAFIFFNPGQRKEGSVHLKSRALLAGPVDDLVDCIPAGVDAFPDDFLSQEQRRHGGVVVHFIILAYICAMTAIVCDNYFVPALEIIVDKLKLSPDVAGATFMAMGASAPELFSSIAGSFITEDDIGVGTVVGSAVFNILGITGVVGILLWKEVLDIDWFPIARDCVVYALTVLTLFLIISDNIVHWWESLTLLIIFFLYIFLMHFNKRMEKTAQNIEQACFRSCCFGSGKDERRPLLPVKSESSVKEEEKSLMDPDFTKTERETPIEIINEDGAASPCRSAWRAVMWPASLLFRITIPPIGNEGNRCCFPLTFLMSVVWMGSLSYLAVWMVTIIGYTLLIPDSVAGLTILAAGASVPDLIATIIVAKNGLGNMAISNLLGSNTFDLSFCLAAPWLVKTLISRRGYLLVYSSAMTYTTGTLLVTLISLVLTFRLSGWHLNRTVGIVCLFLYAAFITLACLFELNVFGDINLPTCF
ncbi:sodium/potassium/calcium exchanger 4-like [Uloborus diversus]|uniref:sodium/potassium/calcium exchanger 4-like n=1 Tax=Uloborus diversus TaxID=327109 RepID=UPI0024091CAE|nr:sodium/potassium/calcium exchanger 4-like [Uloborus diversus]